MEESTCHKFIIKEASLVKESASAIEKYINNCQTETEQLKREKNDYIKIIEDMKVMIINQRSESEKFIQENVELQAHIVLVRSENERLLKAIFEKISSFQQCNKDWRKIFCNLKAEITNNVDFFNEEVRKAQDHINILGKNMMNERNVFQNEILNYENIINQHKGIIKELDEEKNRLSKTIIEKDMEFER